MLDWLNQNAGAMQALFALGILVLTVALVGITAWYARTTDEALKLSRELSERQWRPDVHTEVDRDFSLLVVNLAKPTAFVKSLNMGLSKEDQNKILMRPVNKLLTGGSSCNLPLMSQFVDMIKSLGGFPSTPSHGLPWHGKFYVCVSIYCAGQNLATGWMNVEVSYEHPSAIRSVLVS